MTHNKYKILKASSYQDLEDKLNEWNEKYDNSVEVLSPIAYDAKIVFYTLLISYVPSAEVK